MSIDEYFRRQHQEEIQNLRNQVEEIQVRLRIITDLFWKIPLTAAFAYLVYRSVEYLARYQGVPFLDWLAISYWADLIYLLLCVSFLAWAFIFHPPKRWRFWFIVEIPQIWMYMWLRYSAGNRGNFWNGSFLAIILSTSIYSFIAGMLRDR